MFGAAGGPGDRAGPAATPAPRAGDFVTPTRLTWLGKVPRNGHWVLLLSYLFLVSTAFTAGGIIAYPSLSLFIFRFV